MTQLSDMNESEKDPNDIPLAIRIPSNTQHGRIAFRPNHTPRPPRERPPLQARNALFLPLGIALGLLALGLIVFLAYRSLSAAGCTTLNANQTELAPASGGFKLSVPPAAFSGEFGVQVAGLPNELLSPTAAQSAWRQAAEALPPKAKVVSGFYTLRVCSNEPKSLNIQLSALPQMTIDPQFAYDMYMWDSKRNQWQWLSSDFDTDTKSVRVTLDKLPENVIMLQTSSPQHTFAVELPVGAGDLTRRLQTERFSMPEWQTRVVVPGLYLGDFGNVAGDRSAVPRGRDFGKNAIVALRNWSDYGEVNRTTLRDMLVADSLRQSHIANLLDVLKTGDYVGIELDYRGIEDSQREQFSALVAGLSKAIRAENRNLSLNVVIPFTAIGSGATGISSGGYDLRAISEAADAVKLDLTARSVTPISSSQFERMIRGLLGEANRHKLQLIVPANGVGRAAQNDYAIRIGEQLLMPISQYQLNGFVIRSTNLTLAEAELIPALKALGAIN